MRAPSDAPRVVATYVSKKPYVTSEVTRFANVRGRGRALPLVRGVAHQPVDEDERSLMLPIGTTTLEWGSNTTMGYRPTTAGARSEVAVGAV